MTFTSALYSAILTSNKYIEKHGILPLEETLPDFVIPEFIRSIIKSINVPPAMDEFTCYSIWSQAVYVSIYLG